MLDDGASQISETTYNTQGSVLTTTDPLGRQTTYTYGTNGVDLLEVRQTTGGMNDLLATLRQLRAVPAADHHRCRRPDDDDDYNAAGPGADDHESEERDDDESRTTQTDGLSSVTEPWPGGDDHVYVRRLRSACGR